MKLFSIQLPNPLATLENQLAIAIRENKKEEIERLINLGANVNPNGNSVLCFCSDIEIAKLLIHHGASVNPKRIDIFTPLLYAILHGRPYEYVCFLLANGANPNAEPVSGWTCFNAATYKKRNDVIKELLRYGVIDTRIKCSCVCPIHESKIIDIPLVERGTECEYDSTCEGFYYDETTHTITRCKHTRNRGGILSNDSDWDGLYGINELALVPSREFTLEYTVTPKATFNMTLSEATTEAEKFNNTVRVDDKNEFTLRELLDLVFFGIESFQMECPVELTSLTFNQTKHILHAQFDFIYG